LANFDVESHYQS